MWFLCDGPHSNKAHCLFWRGAHWLVTRHDDMYGKGYGISWILFTRSLSKPVWNPSYKALSVSNSRQLCVCPLHMSRWGSSKSLHMWMHTSHFHSACHSSSFLFRNTLALFSVDRVLPICHLPFDYSPTLWMRKLRQRTDIVKPYPLKFRFPVGSWAFSIAFKGAYDIPCIRCL